MAQLKWLITMKIWKKCLDYIIVKIRQARLVHLSNVFKNMYLLLLGKSIYIYSVCALAIPFLCYRLHINNYIHCLYYSTGTKFHDPVRKWF